MQANCSDINFLVGNQDIIINSKDIFPLKPFDNEVINFFNALSKKLMTDGKAYPDVITFAFWCRNAALIKEKEKYLDLDLRMGRGIALHITPSNVPVNCAFSFASGLLAGNINLVRVPTKNFEQVNIICTSINKILQEDFQKLKDYICFFKSPQKKEVNDYLSSLCNSRIIWGGDNTIAEIRKSPIPSRTNEITFANRHSLAVINAGTYNDLNNKEKFIQDFYNDTYYSDQNACTSPRFIFWLGSNSEIIDAKSDFWSRLHTLVREKYVLEPVQSVGKLSAFYKLSSKFQALKIEQNDEYITRINLKKLTNDITQYMYNSGFFIEYDAKCLSDILPICNNKCQTVSYLGLETAQIAVFFDNNRPFGIDRFVPIGKTMDFSLVWDGYDLIHSLSRKYSIL